MAVIAGLFDQQAEATNAMDEVLRLKIKDLDSRVIETQGNQDQAGGGFVAPVIPNTSGGPSQGLGGAGVGAVGVPGFSSGDMDWLDELDEVERAFYYEGYREGATLAMVRVDDDHANHIRQIFRDYNARTYVND